MIFNAIRAKKLCLLICFAVAGLTACGGGGGGTVATTPSSTAVVLTTLTNGQGVARVKGSGRVGLIFSPDISVVTRDFNAASSSGPLDASPENFPIVSSTATTTTRRGTLTEGTQTINVTFLNNNSTTNAYGLYFELSNDADLISVIGNAATAVPDSGTIIYTGVLSQNARSIVAPGQLGSFSIQVNYALKTFSIVGSAGGASLSGSGAIDTASGLFATSNASFGISGFTYSASIYGNLNGTGASSVSGVFYTNDSTPDYAGSFIGSR